MDNIDTTVEDIDPPVPVVETAEESVAVDTVPELKSDEREVVQCLNCGNNVAGNYCPECGQAADTRRLTFSNVTENLANAFISLERGAPRTLVMLFSRPGVMIREFIEGKRVSYVRPFSLLMVLCGVYGVLLMFMGDLFQIHGDTQFAAEVEFEETARLTVEEYLKLMSSPIIPNLLLIPIYALFSMWIFGAMDTGKRNFTEYCFISAYISCMTLVVSMISYLLNKSVGLSFMQMSVIEYIFTFFFFAVTYKNFLSTKWWPSIWRSVAVVILSTVAFVFLMLIILIILAIKNLGVW